MHGKRERVCVVAGVQQGAKIDRIRARDEAVIVSVQ